MKKYTLFPLLTIILLQLTCTKDAFTGFIHPEFRLFIEDFIEEGKKRGVELDIKEMEAFLVNEFSKEPSRSTVCGFGWWNYEHNGRRIEILNSENCWGNRTYIEKENIIFHELGHAFLARNHISDTLPNRYAKSIMCSPFDGGCSSNYTTYYDNPSLRSYFLDELFNEDTPLPEFANRNQYNRTVFEEGVQKYYTDWELFIIGDPSNRSNFQFSQDTSAAGIPTTITLSTDGSTLSTPPSAILVKRFELTDFPTCSNLKAFADIRAEGITEGEFQMALSLRERVAPDSLHRFFLDRKIESVNGNYQNYLHELYCLDDRTDIVSISFNLESTTPASITIDDLLIDLYE